MRYEILIEKSAQKSLSKIPSRYRDRIINASSYIRDSILESVQAKVLHLSETPVG